MRSSLLCSLVLGASVLVAACDGNAVATTTEGSAGTAGDGSGASGGSGGDTASSGGAGGNTTSSATTTDTSPGTGGNGGSGGTAEGCAALAVLTLSDPKFVDADGDGKWSPGESAAVVATMTNPTDKDIDYPGITWSSNEPLVSSAAPYNAFFVIFAGESMPIDVGFQADPATPTGTNAQLTGRLTDIQGTVCDELPSVTLDVVIE